MKASIKDWLIVLVALLDDAAAVALVVLALWYFGVKLPLWSIIIIGLGLGSLAFIAHRAIIPSLHMKKAAGPETMLGMVGLVVEPLKPKGCIRLGDEYWRARSAEGNIAAGKLVEVLGRRGLTLEVRRRVGGEQ